MKSIKVNLFLLSIIILVIISGCEPVPQSEPREPVTFTKEDDADPALPENQDRITDIVWITRGNNQDLYNAYNETGYSPTSPSDTEWALGATHTHEDEADYTTWVVAIESNPQGHLYETISLHLITDDIYFDVEFTSYTGGGFSYTRLQVDPPDFD